MSRGVVGWESGGPSCVETERSLWVTDGDPNFLSSHCFGSGPCIAQGYRAEQGLADREVR